MSKLAKFKKAMEKKDIDTSFSEITDWLSFPSLAMNWVVTNSFRKGVPNRRSTLFGGPSGTGKTLQLLELAKNAQAIGYTVIYMDSEGALTMDDLKKVGVNDDPEKFMPLSVTTTEEVISIFIDSLGIFDKEDKIMFVLDSASGLFSEKEESTLDGGKLQNDMGRSAKTAKQMIKSINSKIRTRDWFFIMSGHTYENMDMMSGDGKYKFSGLGAAAYFPSVTVLLTKLNLKDGKDQIGIKMNFVTKKTRYNQLGLSCRIDVPYDTGIDKYSGVLEILKEKGYVDGAGAWYSYGNADGEVVKFQSKTFADHAEFLIDRYESENNLAYEETEED